MNAPNFIEFAPADAESHMNDALTALYFADSLDEAREALAAHLALIFGDDHEAAARVVATSLTARVLRGLECECVGSVPGNAIDEACHEFEERAQ